MQHMTYIKKYFGHLKDFSLIQQTAKFRCSDHDLTIEVYVGIKHIVLENKRDANCIENKGPFANQLLL